MLPAARPAGGLLLTRTPADHIQVQVGQKLIQVTVFKFVCIQGGIKSIVNFYLPQLSHGSAYHWLLWHFESHSYHDSPSHHDTCQPVTRMARARTGSGPPAARRPGTPRAERTMTFLSHWQELSNQHFELEAWGCNFCD